MDEIIPGLFLGSECNAMDTKNLQANNVTHILTLNMSPLHIKYRKDLTYKFIHVMDSLEADLLTKFNDCFGFIDDALNNQKAVLVHCVVGVSRSATIVIAYLMNNRKSSFSETYDFVQSKRSIICPNPNFRNQLDIFEQMGYTINEEFLPYKRYRLHHCAQKCREVHESESLKDLVEGENILKQTATIHSNTNLIYKCRKCRMSLFSDQNLIPHLVQSVEEQRVCDEALLGKGPEFDIEDKQSLTIETNNKICEENQLFVEPMEWMKEDIYQMEGKLSCPKCQCKIGSFTWIGEPCVCKEWICPAFHIGSQRVDKCSIKTKL